MEMKIVIKPNPFIIWLKLCEDIENGKVTIKETKDGKIIIGEKIIDKHPKKRLDKTPLKPV